MIIHVDPRFPGACNDAYALRLSQISALGDNGTFGEYYLLGDSGWVNLLML